MPLNLKQSWVNLKIISNFPDGKWSVNSFLMSVGGNKRSIAGINSRKCWYTVYWCFETITTSMEIDV